MKMISILPVDSYIVINKSLLNDNDRKILTMLYQPIIGSTAINLYFSLWSDLNKIEIMSKEYTHHHLMTTTRMKLDEIVICRKKLEALGLLKTFFKISDINNYVYELYSPLQASEFFSNPILAISLFSSIGKKEYEELISYFQMPKVNLNDFENISARFSDIYNLDLKKAEDVTNETIKKKEKLEILVQDFVDFEFISKANKGILNTKALNKDTKSLINNLAYLYNFDNMTISNIIKNSVNESGMILEPTFKKNCKNYYSFENKGELPNLIYKKNKKEEKITTNIREKLINCFQTTSPYEFLKSKYKGGKPTNKDLTLLENLLADQKLEPGVVNVLVDYVLRVNDSKLNKNLVEAIASQWKMLEIKTVEEAMRQAESEYKKRKEYKTQKSTTKEVKLPHWYNKEKNKEVMTKEEEEELKNMLKDFE